MNVDTAFNLISRAWDSGRMAQAYVVVGNPRGDGLRLTEKVLQLVFCTSETARPCGDCRACCQALALNHSDLVVVEPHMKSRRISVLNMRELQQSVYQTSFEGGWKVCVIISADRMGREAANAFLKTLEEPPPRTLFLLLTDTPQSLLPTIISRCQRLVLTDGEATCDEELRDNMFGMLYGREYDPEGKARLLSYILACGRAGQMSEFLKQIRKNIEDAEVAGENDDDKTLDARITARYREVRQGLVAALLSWYRDLLVLTCSPTTEHLVNRKYYDTLVSMAGRLTYRQAMRNLTAVQDMHRNLEKNLSDVQVMRDLFAAVVE